MAARLTGLSAHVIRVWEQRYEAVKPRRSGSNRRLYSRSNITRLELLRNLSREGHRIGLIARLPTGKLRALARQSAPRTPRPAPPEKNPDSPSGILRECIIAIKEMDAPRFEQALRQASVSLGSIGVVQRVMAPLAQSIGDLWLCGEITVAHEHFASALIRSFLWSSATSFATPRPGPVLIVATPSGQLHELGALLVMAMAASLGWRVVYLGASLPAAEIAGAAKKRGARAVALSVVYPADDPALPGQLSTLRSLLPRETAVLIGGRAMDAYRNSINAIRAIPINDLLDLSVKLDQLRKVGALENSHSRKMTVTGKAKSHCHPA